ncbi:MAG TPA: site-specific integrase, partial [Pyrinomonadaceae bacterium]
MIDQLLTQFLDHLRYERNVSAHTLRNYESDLRQFLDYLTSIETEEAKASKRSSRPEKKKRN